MDNAYLMHYGVLGMHWGVRRYQPYPPGVNGKEVGKAARLAKKITKAKSKISKNTEKINKLTKTYPNSKRAQRLEIKKTKYQNKLDKLRPSVNRMKAKMDAYGTLRPGYFGRKKMLKTYKLETKIARINRKQNVWKQKVNKLEYKNTKLNHKIEKYNRQYVSALSNVSTDVGRDYVKSLMG